MEIGKVEETSFSIVMKESDNVSVYNTLNQWRDFVEASKAKSENPEDEWYEIEAMPGLLFKNLRIINSDTESDSAQETEVTFTFNYDAVKKEE